MENELGKDNQNKGLGVDNSIPGSGSSGVGGAGEVGVASQGKVLLRRRKRKLLKGLNLGKRLLFQKVLFCGR